LNTLDKILFLLLALTLGIAISLVQTFEEYKGISDIIVTCTGMVSFFIALYEFFKNNKSK
jgi:hypothetical protein